LSNVNIICGFDKNHPLIFMKASLNNMHLRVHLTTFSYHLLKHS